MAGRTIMGIHETKIRLQANMDERQRVGELHEQVMSNANKREDRQLTDAEREQVRAYATRANELDAEIAELYEIVEREEKAAEQNKLVRQHLAGQAPGVDRDGDGIVKYRTFAAFARDKIITKRGDVFDKIAHEMGGAPVRLMAEERLMRAPAHTLTDDIGGLLPPQHIAQIMDVIDASRPVVASARRVSLDKNVITYPKISQRPQVLEQSTEKTEGGTLDMKVDMASGTAHTFIGGGNLSWQAINWSSPDALELWFQLAAEQYARATETFAAGVLGSAATAGGTIATAVAGTSSYVQWVAGIVAGVAAVYDDSGAMANSLYLSPDVFFALAAKTSDQGVSLINIGGLNMGDLSGSIGGLRVVTSYGFGTAFAAVGDSNGFLIAETSGAPVDLRAVEPAIGGLEVGVIGAIAAESIDDTRFTRLINSP